MLKKIVRNILYIVGFFIAAGLVACLSSGDLELIVEYIIPMIVGLIIFTIVLSIFAMIMGTIGKFLGKSEYKYQKLSIEDIRKHQEYYRDILNVNSPLVISLVDDYEVEMKDIIAELLFLKKNKIIDFENDKIRIMENNDFCFNEIDRYVVESIKKYGKLVVNREELLDRTLIEANDLNLLKRIYEDGATTNKMDRLIIKTLFIGIVVWFLIIWLLSFRNGSFYKTADAMGWVVAIPVCFLVYGCVWKYSSLNIAMPYKRTKKGETLNKKLEGLKNYLKDYSLLDEKEANEIEMWEDYLVYSVIFGQNQKIVEEYERFVEIEDEDKIL